MIDGINRNNTVPILNRLVAIHNRSLPMYLSNTRPWTTRRDEAARETLSQIARDQKATVDRLGEMILDYGGVVELGAYPMRFTSTHDLSMEFLVGELIRRQRDDIEAIEQCVRQLGHDTMAKSLAEEALREAKGHLEALEELTTDRTRISGVPSSTGLL